MLAGADVLAGAELVLDATCSLLVFDNANAVLVASIFIFADGVAE